MRIKEENRNIFLLATVTLCCVAAAGTVALFDLAPELAASGPAPATQVAERATTELSEPTPVRVVGAPFAPNVNPRER